MTVQVLQATRDTAAQIWEHLKREFGVVRECHCDVRMPEVGTRFVTDEAILTCHQSTGKGLIEQALPPGRYQVIRVSVTSSGHWMWLLSMNTGETVYLTAGYADGKTMDWRGIRNFLRDRTPEASAPEVLTPSQKGGLF